MLVNEGMIIIYIVSVYVFILDLIFINCEGYVRLINGELLVD